MSVKEKVFTAYNAHVSECGRPPHIEANGTGYRGYFENQHGEQWMFSYDSAAGVATLRGGDAGWDRSFDLKVREDGWALGMPMMNPVEQEWLTACVRAATARAGHEPGRPLPEAMRR